MRKKTRHFQITKEKLIDMLDASDKGISVKDIEDHFKVSKRARRIIKRKLKEMMEKGMLVRSKNRRYSLAKKGIIHDKKEVNGVAVKKVTKIAGFVRRSEEGFYIESGDEKNRYRYVIYSDSRTKRDLREGVLASARVIQGSNKYRAGSCKVVKTFDELGDIKSLTEFIKYKYDLPLRFKRDVEEEAKKSDITDGMAKRKDLRGLKHVTIDGETAKDFDDAVCVEKTGDGYILYVSIADVSHFVKPETLLDREAFLRGTSIYFPNTVLPMLPKILSNVKCSLNPEEERLAVTVRLSFDKNGERRNCDFFSSVIKSSMRLTYNKVESYLKRREKKVVGEVKGISKELEWMEELAIILSEKRRKRGSLDFDLPEPEVNLDMEGGIKEIIKKERLFSHKIIEEFMIAANEAVAETLYERKIPAIYRVHEQPDQEKLNDFKRMLFTLPLPDIHKEWGKKEMNIQGVLERAKGTDYEFLLNRVLLRAMKQARYSSENRGHYGLASDCYLHFTSPIRRYPDLICHRALKRILGMGYVYPEEELERMAIYLSERERLAMEAEREEEDRIKILFMKDKIGEIYDGIISHITPFGFFTELMEIFVEGLTLLSELRDDYYIFQEEKFRLIGRRTKKILRIGDRVKIRVVLADVERGRLHFALVERKGN
ncbi:MAG: ribonuclease R [Syntrophorhabdaceae bacterium]|nr:ribonuclease R [Syntrophorhabdaceae bacterium]